MRKRFVVLGAALMGLCALLTLGAVWVSGAQRLSPPAKASCHFSDGKAITVDYSSPRVRGRKIFGGLVPYGKVWILGANEATTFDTTANLTVDGKNVPAGSYTLFAIPNPKSWTLIINKTSRDAIGSMSYYPGEESDLVRLPMTSSTLPSKQEDFAVSFVPHGNACTVRFDWDTTRASISFSEAK